MEVVVEFDYIAKEADELTIKKGDIIKNVIKKQDGWWEGVLNEKKGMFPDNFVKVMDKETGVVLRKKKDISRIRQCRVLFSYHQDHEDELNLNVGDIITIAGEVEEGWWRGQLNGKEGVFPSNFVEEILPTPARPSTGSRESLIDLVGETDSNAPALPAKPTKQLCEVKYSYEAQNDDELTLNEGEMVTLLSKEGQDPGWWKGELNGKVGVFPDNFVVIIPTGEEKPSTRDEKIPPKPVSEPTPLKPSTITSQQRKSLEAKSDSKVITENAAKTPPVPGKKPIISLKKSPSGSGSSIFTDIKKKLTDVVDGTIGSKHSKTDKNDTAKDTSSDSSFDLVERGSMLSDVRATRARAPGRRPPKCIFKDGEDGVVNGNADYVNVEILDKTTDSSSSETDANVKPKRVWEQQKAPWLEEMKQNQKKRTSLSPGRETKSKVSQTPTELNESKASPTEKEPSPIDMSKSMPSLSFKAKTPPNELEKEKAPVPKQKPAVPTHSRHSLDPQKIVAKPPESPQKTSASVPSKPAEPSQKLLGKSPEPSPKPAIPISLKIAQFPNKIQKPITVEHNHDPKSQPEVNDSSSAMQYQELLERIQKLEVLLEKQNTVFSSAIEELRGKLQVETDMRMLLQAELEKLTNNV